MTPRQYRSLAKYTGAIAKDMGLGSMDLNLHDSDPGHGMDGSAALASFEGVYGRNTGTIRVCPDFDRYQPEDQRMAIVHELLHAHTERLRSYVRTALPAHLGGPAFDLFMAGYTQHDEYATDALATSIANLFPLWEG